MDVRFITKNLIPNVWATELPLVSDLKLLPWVTALAAIIPLEVDSPAVFLPAARLGITLAVVPVGSLHVFSNHARVIC